MMVVSTIFRTFPRGPHSGHCLMHPWSGNRFLPPQPSRDVPEPWCDKHQCRVAVGEIANHTRPRPTG